MNDYVSLLLQHPVFGTDEGRWILLGDFPNERLEKGGSGFLIGRGDKSPDLRSVPMWLSRSRCFCLAGNSKCALSYSRSTVSSPTTPEENNWHVEIYDFEAETSGKLPFWDSIAKSIGLPVALDLTSGKERMIAYRASDGALILANASGTEVLKRSDQNSRGIPTYGYGAQRGHSNVALSPEFAAFAEADSIVLVELASLARKKIILPVADKEKAGGRTNP